MYLIDRTAVVLKPTEVFLNWLKSCDDDLPDLTLAQLRANCSVFLVPQFDEPEQAVAYFDEKYQWIFEAELSSWAIERPLWPKQMDLQTFWEFFDLEVHDTVTDLEEAQWHVSPLPDNMA
ncbi:hypothetical protein LNQ82_00445 [Conchiformibius steedae DSM 2580]|uniref:Uncharacterized protein n=2 Tax=Conchiformibius steedae TaxID=153493 RepID=A0A3P2A4R2_9NEIS|nr:hypothetical protein [Conchiformibius steedae]QMT33040.1 hypothetical protein H3L98_07995 [Conchiformibius steedae]RRD90394.1 hypothetical protein EII21_05610 [Conchiformibius steedae]URD67667.1 hypothetical protein LNQ82_00445 [Conchiformibius steedae DSM 2580]